jgi:hypothetical protein
MGAEPDLPPVHNRVVWALASANALLVGALAGYAGVVSARQPHDVPAHDTLGGEADVWVDNGPDPLLILPVLALLLAALLVTTALLLPRLRLYRFGLPQRARFMALPWPQQVPLVRSLVLLILAIALVSTTVIGVLVVTVFSPGTGELLPPDPLVVGLLSLSYWVVIVPWLFVLRRHLTEALTRR